MDIGQIAMKRIVDARVNAEKKFPGFPEDVVHCAGMLSEDSGEVTKAALDLYYGRESDPEKLMEEVAQTGAMALRFLIRLLDSRYYPSQKGGDK